MSSSAALQSAGGMVTYQTHGNMSDYYNPNRGSAWNYGGGNWKLSRSKIDLFLECPRCFYLDNKLGVKRPPGYPFNLNTAVDTLLKKEFDTHRAKNKRHPLQDAYGLDMVPARHPQLDEWRDNFKGITFLHPKTGMLITGALDDVWQSAGGEYHVVDYKATSKGEDITRLNDTWHRGYKRQMEVYQWLLRRNGLQVSDTGYFVYCNGRTDREAFDGKLEFDVTVIPYIGDCSWIEGALVKIKKALDSPLIPAASRGCDYCRYRAAVHKAGTD